MGACAARCGFCRECGSSLFWDGHDRPTLGIAAGTLDVPTTLKTIRHIFVADQGDYYEIADGLERWPGTKPPAGLPAV
ncbi:MAG TPA: GFA family protein [Azospirillaceae bacterium]|nr:GFA family protein [Azospirillaceae bacterium]